MKTQKFGVEIELTGITREQAAKVIADYYNGTWHYDGGFYGKYKAIDRQGRKWTIMYDSSIKAERKDHADIPVDEQDNYRCEVVTPICGWDYIEDIQEIVRQLRHKGAIANASCGIHVHVGAEQYTAKTLRNLVNIMNSKEDLLFKALGVSTDRAGRWCKKSEQEFVAAMNRSKPTSTRTVQRLWYEDCDDGYRSRTDHYNASRYHALNLHSLWQGKGIEFRCFNGTTHAGKIKTYIQLCLAISHQALTQRGATAKKTETANEKYTFRTWLLRMGMIGEEFETARKFLLENLEGDIAFRNGRPTVAA